MSTTDTLDDDHPLFLVNEQIKGLLEGDGASEDHEDVVAFLRKTGLPEGTVAQIHRALVCAEKTAHLREALAQQEPVAWMHNSSDRVDVIHAKVKTLLEKTDAHFHRPQDKAANYTIPLYARPISQAPSVPVAAIEKVLAEVMEIAVSNGANSVSMPDEYVEIAAWLHSLAAAPKPEESR